MKNFETLMTFLQTTMCVFHIPKRKNDGAEGQSRKFHTSTVKKMKKNAREYNIDIHIIVLTLDDKRYHAML